MQKDIFRLILYMVTMQSRTCLANFAVLD